MSVVVFGALCTIDLSVEGNKKTVRNSTTKGDFIIRSETSTWSRTKKRDSSLALAKVAHICLLYVACCFLGTKKHALILAMSETYLFCMSHAVFWGLRSVPRSCQCRKHIFFVCRMLFLWNRVRRSSECRKHIFFVCRLLFVWNHVRTSPTSRPTRKHYARALINCTAVKQPELLICLRCGPRMHIGVYE